MATRVLIIDDDRDTADFLKLLVEPRGDLARTASDAAQAREILRSWRPEVVLMDLMLPDADGIDLLKDFKEASPETQVIMVTGYGSVPKAVEAMKAGAFSFIEKPVDADVLLVMLDKATEKLQLSAENKRLKEELRDHTSFANIVARSDKMRQLFHLDQIGCADRRERADPRRERDGQRARRQRHSRAQQAEERPVHQDQLRRSPERADRIRAVRTQARRLHRCGVRQDRPDGTGRWRFAAARRDRRDAGQSAGQAASRAAGPRVPAGRRQPRDPAELQADLRDQHQPGCRAWRGKAARRPVLPHQHRDAGDSAAARPHGRHSAAGRALPRSLLGTAPAQHPVDQAGSGKSAAQISLAWQRARARARHRARGHRGGRYRTSRSTICRRRFATPNGCRIRPDSSFLRITRWRKSRSSRFFRRSSGRAATSARPRAFSACIVRRSTTS